MADDLMYDFEALDEQALDLALFDAILSATPLEAASIVDSSNAESDTTADCTSSASIDFDDTAALLFTDAVLGEFASSASPSPSSPVGSSTQECAFDTKSIPTQPSTASTSARQPTKRPRKHNRIEILKLRDLVDELEARVTTLRRHHGGGDRSANERRRLLLETVCRAQVVALGDARVWPSTASSAVTARYERQCGSQASMIHDSTTSPSSLWLDVATEQYAALQQSQKLNLRLRAAVTQQCAKASSLQTLLRGQSTIEVRSLLCRCRLWCLVSALVLTRLRSVLCISCDCGDWLSRRTKSS